MKNVAIVLAAGVVASLITYGFLEWHCLLGLTINGHLVIAIATFVGTLAAVGFGSATLALFLKRAFTRADDALVQRLEARLARLESAQGRSAGPIVAE